MNFNFPIEQRMEKDKQLPTETIQRLATMTPEQRREFFMGTKKDTSKKD